MTSKRATKPAAKPDSLASAFDLGIVKITCNAAFAFRAELDVGFLPGVTLADINVSGFTDKDGDGNPEFAVSVAFLGGEAIALESVEIDPSILAGMITGASAAQAQFIKLVQDAVDSFQGR